MDWQLNISILLSIGTVVASVAATIAIVKTKLTVIEGELEAYGEKTDAVKEDLSRYISSENVKIAVLENNQENHDKELNEIKSDLKTIMKDVQDVKEAVIKTKGE